MSGEAAGETDNVGNPAGTGADSARLQALEAKIAAAKRSPPARAHNEEHYSQAQLAWRMVTELVA
ncbi:MAG: hypothetical protein AAF646_13880, partial [Pseudomonadota bacterium]